MSHYLIIIYSGIPISPPVQNRYFKCRYSVQVKVQDEKVENTEERASLAIKGKNALWIPRLVFVTNSRSRPPFCPALKWHSFSYGNFYHCSPRCEEKIRGLSSILYAMVCNISVQTGKIILPYFTLVYAQKAQIHKTKFRLNNKRVPLANIVSDPGSNPSFDNSAYLQKTTTTWVRELCSGQIKGWTLL